MVGVRFHPIQEKLPGLSGRIPNRLAADLEWALWRWALVRRGVGASRTGPSGIEFGIQGLLWTTSGDSSELTLGCK